LKLHGNLLLLSNQNLQHLY